MFRFWTIAGAILMGVHVVMFATVPFPNPENEDWVFVEKLKFFNKQLFPNETGPKVSEKRKHYKTRKPIKR